MSRIGKRPIILSDQVVVTYINSVVTVDGPRGQLFMDVPVSIGIKIIDRTGSVEISDISDFSARSMVGTIQARFQNMVTGVTSGFQKKLLLVGVGYKALVNGDRLELSLGYSHPVIFLLPMGVSALVTGNTQILLEGCDKELLGQTSAKIRAFRPPEPYKGKGILVDGEKVIRKAGKTGKK